MKKLFVSADVHGFYDEWMKALTEADFDIDNKDHIIVHCGDLLDRGHQPMKCLHFVNSLDDDRKILICGNHELLLDDLIARGYPYSIDESNGTMDTIRDITGIFGHDKDAINEIRHFDALSRYRNSLMWYAEIGNYIFVHSWIPCIEDKMWKVIKDYKYNSDWRNASARRFIEATWLNPFECWEFKVREKDKTIVHGHLHTSYGHANIHNKGVEFVDETKAIDENNIAYYTPFEDEGICSLDACTVVSGFVNVKVLEVSDEEYLNRKH